MLTNIGITATFCEIARRGLVERLVHMSSSEAYGSGRYVPMDEAHPDDAITPYAARKGGRGPHHPVLRADLRDRCHGRAPVQQLRPAPEPGLLRRHHPDRVQRVERGLPIEIHGDGEQTRDFTFVRDTADFTVAIHETPAARGEEINVATGVGTSINHLVARILEIMGAPDHEIVHTAERPGDVRRHEADARKLVELVGRQPGVLGDEGLVETVEWYRKTLG